MAFQKASGSASSRLAATFTVFRATAQWNHRVCKAPQLAASFGGWRDTSKSPNILRSCSSAASTLGQPVLNFAVARFVLRNGFVKYTSVHTQRSLWLSSARERGTKSHAVQRVEYSVVQLTEGTGWRWEIRFDDGKTKSGVSRVSRAVAIKIARSEIDRALKDTR